MAAFVPPQYRPPTPEEALQDPGYQFRLGQGQKALESSAAARGVLRTGGTLKDILQYGQDFGQQEYGNVFNRSLQAYDRQYQGAKDKAQMDWEQYMFANTPRGGGGGRREPDIPPPPPDPGDGYYPEEEAGGGDPYAEDPRGGRRDRDYNY